MSYNSTIIISNDMPRKLHRKRPLIALILLIVITSLVSYSVISGSHKASISPQSSPTPSISPSAIPSIEIASESAAKKPQISTPAAVPVPKKQTYTIAAFGDSMIDTMGENLDYLQKSLSKRYPKTRFKLYNYGIGSQNVVEGLARFHNPYIYKSRNFPPIDQINADVIIISSFAYNPLVPYDRDKHWTTLSNLIKEAQKSNAKVYLLAEIAPLKNGFGKGPGGIDWTDEMIKTHIPRIIEQLDNAVKLSQNLNVPLINAYSASRVDGKYGNPIYVSSHDGIHPSIAGEIFMADIISSIIKLD